MMTFGLENYQDFWELDASCQKASVRFELSGFFRN
jgi:hypothetical protein